MEFEVGEYAEGLPWRITEGEKIEIAYTRDPCPHAIKDGEYYVIPATVEARNEAGCAATLVCVACLEAGIAAWRKESG